MAILAKLSNLDADISRYLIPYIGYRMRVSKECEIASFYRMRKVFTRIDIAYLLYCIV